MDMSISKQDHDYYIRHAIKLSESAVEHGNEPFGACLVSKDGEILLSAENTIRMPNRDCTRHAELNLISMATQKFDRETLKDCTLYTSCEPCIMCSGAFLWSGIQRLVYAMASTTLGKYAGFTHLHSCRTFITDDGYSIFGPVLEDEASRIHQTFWDTFFGKQNS